MIRRAWPRIVGFLTSAGLAVGLLVFVGVWSMVATFIPQGDPRSAAVAGWAAANATLEPVVRTMGLHQAFSSPAFIACVLLLGVSTTLCAWRRTKGAISRTRALRVASGTDTDALSARHDLEIAVDPAMDSSEVLSVASETLGRLGIRARLHEGVLKAVATPVSVWGSTIFHWALVALLVVISAGQLLRSEGSMALAVGQTKADTQESYVSVSAGPWRDRSGVRRSIRVDSFDPAYTIGGIDRGAVPTVSVLDGSGKVTQTQRVYPNSMLHSGSLSISAPACGLSASLVLLGPGGAVTGRVIQYVDFSQVASEGTVPLGTLLRTLPGGQGQMRLAVTVPLDRVGGQFGEWIPKQPAARVSVTSSDGDSLLDKVIRPDEYVELPGGERLRLVDIGWYSRLSIVDDRTVPLVYASMITALIGLAVSLLARQQLFVAAVVGDANHRLLAVNMRLWRNVPTTRKEVESALVLALGGEKLTDAQRSGNEKRSTS